MKENTVDNRVLPTALFLLFFLLPTYLIRFRIGPLPTTFLEIMIWIVFVMWLTKGIGYRVEGIVNIAKRHKTLFIFILLFLLAATISIFTSVNIRAALGEWKAFYVEPILVFLIFVTSLNNGTMKQWNNRKSNFQFSIFKKPIDASLFALILCGLATSALAIYQHFTGWLVPYSFWENADTYRVTAWYRFPNAVGLFLAPLVPLAIYLVKESWEPLKSRITELKNSTILQFLAPLLFIPFSILAIIFAKSTGGLIGVAAGIGTLLFFNKKTRIPVIACGAVALITIMFMPNNTIKQELLANNRSGQIHRAIWSETIHFLGDHPIAGAGLASYQKKIAPYHTTVNGEGIEIFQHPHNIFLTMWINLGLLGLIAFIGIIVWFYRTGLKIVNCKLKIFLMASMTTLLVTGLVDSPYIKNDLSMFFWFLIASMVIAQTEKTS